MTVARLPRSWLSSYGQQRRSPPDALCKETTQCWLCRVSARTIGCDIRGGRTVDMGAGLDRCVRRRLGLECRDRRVHPRLGVVRAGRCAASGAGGPGEMLCVGRRSPS